MTEAVGRAASAPKVPRSRASSPRYIADSTRARAIVVLCALATIAFSAFAALGSQDLLITVVALFLSAILAFVLPFRMVVLTLAALIPLQIYFPFGGSLNMRGAFVFVIAAAMRLLFQRIATRNWWRWHTWVIPAALFMLAALIASFTAFNRYTALKGIYDWLPVFATAFVVGEIVHSERLLRASIIVLIVGGVVQAALGLIESVIGLSNVVDALQSGIAPIFFQPNLLRQRLADFSFNWVLDGRVVPFGTFINGIDYAIFIAAILSLAFAWLLGARRRDEAIALLIVAALLGIVLLRTFKGSGMIALAAGIAVVALMYFPRLSWRAQMTIVLLAIVAVVGAFILSEPLAQRLFFLVERELGLRTETGRTAIWASLIAQLPQRPLFGFGLNNAISLVPVLPSMNGGAYVFNTPAAESAYVATLIETGIVGFGALIWFVGVVFVQAYLNAKTFAPIQIGVLAAIAAILTGNLTVAALTTDQNGMLLGALIGLTFAIPYFSHESRE
ncbi:MAG: O-antigen ligase family protein [Chloroflexi bacterium]|nr:O-antigen ligase family protein [Chloroflexota bacterium]